MGFREGGGEPQELSPEDLIEINPEEADAIEAKHVKKPEDKRERKETDDIRVGYRDGEVSAEDACKYFGCSEGWHSIGCPVGDPQFEGSTEDYIRHHVGKIVDGESPLELGEDDVEIIDDKESE